MKGRSEDMSVVIWNPNEEAEYRRRNQEIVEVAMERARLTPTETKVMKYLLCGWTREQVCNELGISLKSLKNHNSSAILKFGVDSKIALLARIFPTYEEPKFRAEK